MSGYKALAAVLGAIVLFQAGVLAGTLGVQQASAQDGDPSWQTTTTAAAAPYPGRLICKQFPIELGGGELTLPEDDGPIGVWVRSHEDAWQIYATDFEVAQKPTGYPQGYTSICLYPR